MVVLGFGCVVGVLLILVVGDWVSVCFGLVCMVGFRMRVLVCWLLASCAVRRFGVLFFLCLVCVIDLVVIVVCCIWLLVAGWLAVVFDSGLGGVCCVCYSCVCFVGLF